MLRTNSTKKDWIIRVKSKKFPYEEATIKIEADTIEAMKLLIPFKYEFIRVDDVVEK